VHLVLSEIVLGQFIWLACHVLSICVYICTMAGASRKRVSVVMAVCFKHPNSLKMKGSHIVVLQPVRISYVRGHLLYCISLLILNMPDNQIQG